MLAQACFFDVSFLLNRFTFSNGCIVKKLSVAEWFPSNGNEQNHLCVQEVFISF